MSMQILVKLSGNTPRSGTKTEAGSPTILRETPAPIINR